MDIQIRLLNDQRDPAIISQAFRDQGWERSPEQYVRYYIEQENGDRVTLVAELDGVFAGYVNVLWHSDYPAFQASGIPEINDLNVLMRYQRQGIGTRLMDEAEAAIRERTDTAGIGVGIFSDYGKAQILYAHRGYIPDGKGIYKHDRYLKYGDEIVIDDDVILYLTKKLK
ncbi:GNAT family N-acetyltransferase [Paenibacillus sp. FSL W8-0426]|uniref:GNAT family N-acetyltransferase n=1 Tax=Paenibacillus sp. FSL W8-0426 TaxID=2921714 RepID=UPI0030D9034F